MNDYLAQRDAEWMGHVHRFLGLSVGLIQVIISLLVVFTFCGGLYKIFCNNIKSQNLNY